MTPDFLTVEDVIEIHEAQLARFGGSSGIRDRPGLESAVAQARASFEGRFLHQDIFAMAAAYAFHVAQNQPFVDGNKRTGLVAASVFLDLNGFELAEDDALYDAMIAIAERRLDKAGLAGVLKKLSSERDPGDAD